jgi:hypothetical protein
MPKLHESEIVSTMGKGGHTRLPVYSACKKPRPTRIEPREGIMVRGFDRFSSR